MNRWKTVYLACAWLAIGASAQTVTTLAYYGDYFSRFSSFTQGRDGNLYGSVIDADYGHIVKVTPAGTLTVLHDFCPQSNCIAGSGPTGPLVLGTDGNFYGALGGGGNTSGYCGLIFGCGTVFKMTPGGTVTVLHSFSGSDGSNPDWLIEGSDGNFYGTTVLGGGSARGFCGCGTIFKLTPAGVFTTLHTFVQTDGDEPNGVMQATDGNLYGTTHAGGKLNRLYCQTRGCGTVFKITTSGVFTSLHSFQVGDGALPYQPPVQASDGTFYGTTFEGANGGDGTIFTSLLRARQRPSTALQDWQTIQSSGWLRPATAICTAQPRRAAAAMPASSTALVRRTCSRSSMTAIARRALATATR